MRGAACTFRELADSDAAWWSNVESKLREGSEYDTTLAARALVERTTTDQGLPLEVTAAGVLSRVATITRTATTSAGEREPKRSPAKDDR